MVLLLCPKWIKLRPKQSTFSSTLTLPNLYSLCKSLLSDLKALLESEKTDIPLGKLKDDFLSCHWIE